MSKQFLDKDGLDIVAEQINLKPSTFTGTTAEWEAVTDKSKYQIVNITDDISDATEMVRDPDWSRAIALNQSTILSGYTCPEDGIFIANGLQTNTPSSYVKVLVNNWQFASGWLGPAGNGDAYSLANVQIPVNKNDVIKVIAWANGSAVSNPNIAYQGISFVPYKYNRVDKTVPSVAGTYNNTVHLFTFKQGVGSYAIAGPIPHLQFNRYSVIINSATMYTSASGAWVDITNKLVLTNTGGFYFLGLQYDGVETVENLAGQWGAAKISYTVTDK